MKAAISNQVDFTPRIKTVAQIAQREKSESSKGVPVFQECHLYALYKSFVTSPHC